MPGNIVIKPIQATFNNDPSTVGKMSAYYVVSLGDIRQKGSTCKNGGKTPKWKDAVTVEKTRDPFCYVALKAKRPLLPDKNLGACRITVEELSEEKSSRWYDILIKDKVQGKILIEANLIAGQGELVDKQGIHPLGTKSANAIDEKEVEPIIENRNAVSLGDLVNNRDGYAVRVIEPQEGGQQDDVMQVPVIEPSADNVDNQQEERKSEEDDKENFQDFQEPGLEPEKQEEVAPRESVGGDDAFEVPEERTEEEWELGKVKAAMKSRLRQEV